MPPNYVHSLDSSHMLMTATRCVAEGLTFAAVHDSYASTTLSTARLPQRSPSPPWPRGRYWTHAADVERMNVILRDAFIELHEATNLQVRSPAPCMPFHALLLTVADLANLANLQELHKDLMSRFPDVQWDKLPEPPPQGDLDIHCVRDSTYFFS